MIQAATQTGLTGMQNSYRNMTEAADRLVRGGMHHTGEPGGDTGKPDTATSLVDMMSEERIFTASAKVVSTSDQALGRLLDATA